MMSAGKVQQRGQQELQVEEALKLLMEFIDLSRDLERNQDDSAARDEGKEIIYVLDENIFEIFFQPREKRHLIRSFHSLRFAGTSWPDPHWPSIEAQLALIASEYLLSGSLPGAKRSWVYMTPWHREELANRIDNVLGELRGRAEGAMDQAASELEGKLNMLKAIESTGDRWGDWLKSDDPWVAGDVEGLRRSGATEEALQRFGMTRVVAEILASSEVHEPIDQLQRAVGLPLSAKYRSFHLDFATNDDERREIRADAQNWHRLLVEERERSSSSHRTDSSLWFDAQSLALVRWAATKRARADQRIVLVTGDTILFSAYRRWYVDKSVNDLEYGEEFLLRRIPQYSPAFNISDSENDISKRIEENNRRIFALITEIVELALLPFNLARLTDTPNRERDTAIARGREYLVMKMLDTKRLSDDKTLSFFTGKNSPLIKMLPQMHSVLDQLRSMERIAIGAFFPYISLRLNKGHRQLAEEITRKGEAGAAQVLRAYLTDLLDTLVNQRLKGWLSVALESVGHFAFDGAGRPRRIPLTIWYPIRDGADLTDLIEQSRTGKKIEWKELVKDIEDRPHAVFAVASALALISNDWSNATRFAEFAVRASRDAHERQVDPASLVEAEFLAVLARRFRLGSFAAHIPNRAGSARAQSSQPDFAVRSIEASRSRFQLAKTRLGTLITRCQNEVYGDASAQQDKEFQRILVMRAQSERAALCLFMAANLAAAQETTDLRWLQSEGLKLVAEAIDDLDVCWRDEQSVGSRHAKYLERIQSQYVPNAAAAHVIGYLLGKEPIFTDAQRTVQVPRIQIFLDQNIARHPILRAELSLFLILAGEASDRNRRALKEALGAEKHLVPLAIDHWLLSRLRTRALQLTGNPSKR